MGGLHQRSKVVISVRPLRPRRQSCRFPFLAFASRRSELRAVHRARSAKSERGPVSSVAKEANEAIAGGRNPFQQWKGKGERGSGVSLAAHSPMGSERGKNDTGKR